MKSRLVVLTVLLALALPPLVLAQGPSLPAGTAVDARGAFPPSVPRAGGRSIPSLARLRAAAAITVPVPGGLGAGTIYAAGALPVTSRAELYTRMIVYPGGIDVPSWIFTTATNRTEKTVEVVGIYIGRGASLGVFDWSCLPDHPCPNGETEPSWQWTRELSTLDCYYTAGDDGGGHVHDLLTYVNRSSRRGSAHTPPRVANWWNAVFLLNSCTGDWDMVYRHDFRAEQRDCSTGAFVCGWWGPIIETFNEDPQPWIPELGFLDSALRYDTGRSQLRPGDTVWSPPFTPWLLFHLDPNRSWGVGNFVGQ